MKTMKRLLSFVLLALCAFSLAACDFNNIISSVKKVQSNVQKPIAQLIDGVDENGHFEENRNYTIAYSHTEKVDGQNVTTTITVSLQFNKNGELVYADQENGNVFNYQYIVEDGLIKCSQEGKIVKYFYYYADVLVEAGILLLVATKDDVAVSQAGSGTLGSVAFVILNQNDTKSALTDDKSNENMYYTLRKNGTISTSGTRVKADQLGKFDTSEKGMYATTLKVGSKTYPVIVLVA